jgi:hypothetical protein
MIRRISLLLCLALAAAGIAEAQSYTPKSAEVWEFSIQTRYTWAQNYTYNHGTKLELDDDIGWGFGFGKYLSPQFNLGLAFNWRSLYYNATAVSADDPDRSISYGNDLETTAIALTGDYMFGQGRLKPYATGNLGWAWLNTNITADIDVGCWYYPFAGYVCYGESYTYGMDAFAYGLGLGLRFDITPTAFLKAGWDHEWTDLDAIDSHDILRVDVGFQL